LERSPKSEEGTKGKREIYSVAGNDLGCLEYPHPVVDHPAPGFSGVKPAQRGSGRSAGLAKASIAFHRIGQIASKRGIGRLILYKFLLQSERHLTDILIKRGRTILQSGPLKLARIEAISRHDLPDHSPKSR